MRDEVFQKLALFTEELRHPYETIMACIFKLYEAQLDRTVQRVKKGKVRESELLLVLQQFKLRLTGDCAVLIEDVWNNYKFYAKQ